MDRNHLRYDPALLNTASCRSGITALDESEGSLLYRGYPIEQLAQQCTYREVAYLLLHGELPTQSQLDYWTQEIISYRELHQVQNNLIEGCPNTADRAGLLVTTLAALSTCYTIGDLADPSVRRQHAVRLIGNVATISACLYRHSRGLGLARPGTKPSHTANLLEMTFDDEATSAQQRALAVMFILLADHEQNCSTHVMRSVGSSGANPYLCTAAAAAAFSGPLHGGASTLVWQMLHEIGSRDAVADYLKRVKLADAPLPGFGHSVYRNHDPRASIIQKLARALQASSTNSLLFEIALEFERQVLEDDYFITRKMYPAVEFYSGIVYDAIGYPQDMFPILCAVARIAGWLAHWLEMLADNERMMIRPRQLYIGPSRRDVTALRRRLL